VGVKAFYHGLCGGNKAFITWDSPGIKGRPEEKNALADEEALPSRKRTKLPL